MIEHKSLHQYLPHRYPMLMVDSFISISIEEIISSFFIMPECIFLENGKLSEAGIMENIAQSASIIIGKQIIDEQIAQNTSKPLIGFISQIKKAHFHTLPNENETLKTTAKLNSTYGDICHISCQCHTNKNLIATAEISLLITEV